MHMMEMSSILQCSHLFLCCSNKSCWKSCSCCTGYVAHSLSPQRACVDLPVYRISCYSMVQSVASDAGVSARRARSGSGSQDVVRLHGEAPCAGRWHVHSAQNARGAEACGLPAWRAAAQHGPRRGAPVAHVRAPIFVLLFPLLSAAMTMLKSLRLRHILHGVPLFFVCKLHAVGSVSELLV